MVSWFQKISSGNELSAERENDKMTVPNYRYLDSITLLRKGVDS